MSTTTVSSLVSNHVFAEVWISAASGQQCLLATKSFKPGDVICKFNAADVCDTPSYLTVQVDDDRHIMLDPEFLQYINHSCDPNVFFDTTSMKLIAMKKLKQGDEFTFFYPSTEWQMDQPFDCYCGTAQCLKTISGANDIPSNVLSRYKLTDYIMHKLKLKNKR
jgi:SET domain